MSLNWSIERIKDYKTKCWIPDPDPNTANAEGNRLNPVTELLIWATMVVDLGQITAENANEFAARLIAYERACGVFICRMEDGKRIDRPITLKDVIDHIGLSTNVSNQSRSYFARKLADRLLREADESVRYQQEELNEVQPTVGDA